MQFDVTLTDTRSTDLEKKGDVGKGPKVYKIRLTKVAEINPMYVVFHEQLKEHCSHF